MVIVALRHAIAEICINTFFDKVANNFNKSVLLGDIRVGDYFKKIVHNDLDEVYYNCTVTAVVDIKDKNGVSNGHQFIYVRFGDYSTEDILDISDAVESLNDEELQQYLDDNNIQMDEYIDIDDIDDIDYSTIDIMETEYDDAVGLNSEYYEFYK